MKKTVLLISGLILLLGTGRLLADDSCIFAVTADDVPPNVVLLLDNGAEMEKILTHPDYVPSTDYTPDVGVEDEGVNGFFNEHGYAIDASNQNKITLRKISPDLSIAESTTDLVAETSSSPTATWTINSKTVTLPAVPSAAVDDSGIKDNAARFRYDTNYLNWIFFGQYNPDPNDPLPDKSNFYQAKEALMQVAKKTANQVRFGIYNFTSNASGASNVQPLSLVVQTPLATLPENNILDSSFVNNINNMGTTTYSPLAEGIQTIGEYYGSPSSGVEATVEYYCQKNFTIVVTPGISSEDLDAEASWLTSQLSDNDYDGDGETDLTFTCCEGNEYNIPINDPISIPTNINGSSHLDDLAQSLYDNDIVDYRPGFQNILTYTVGLGQDPAAQAYLINTSNNGNGNTNLYDTSDPDYAKYHFQAKDPSELADELEEALQSILENTATFTAPVVPVTRTSSGDYIYLSLFKPFDDSIFWQGNVAKFGLGDKNENIEDNEIIDLNGDSATEPNGALKEDAVPYWSTLNWASDSAPNYMDNTARNIYTYKGDSDLTAATNDFRAANISPVALGYLPEETEKASKLVNYVRGADAYAETDNTQNRELITADALHSEPAVFSFTYLDSTGNPDTENTITRVFYGANDGMLHAVNDADGTESWAFVPPDLLNSLKLMVEGVSHNVYVDASPKIYFLDVNNDGYIDRNTDEVILVFGERRGGTSYWALDITEPDTPEVLWTINPTLADYSELGESWSEPNFGKVKDGNDTRDVLFIGGGYSEDNSKGRAVYVIDTITGEKIKEFSIAAGNATGMDYSIASNITLIDGNDDGFIDKAYVGDMGGNLWRLGRFTDSLGDPLSFYAPDQNIDNWDAQILFSAGSSYRFFYPPTVALESGYDVVFAGTGNREDACAWDSNDRIYAIKDNHQYQNLTETDLVNVNGTTYTPLFDSFSSDVDENLVVDKGWYYPLAAGEKVLAEGVVFYKIFYITTFIPNTDPCVPGGYSYLYGLGYKTGAPELNDGSGNNVANILLGGGIASKPVVIIRNKTTMLVSVGSTMPSETTDDTGAGVVDLDPPSPPPNLFMRWWREVLD